jgi:2-haloalkanoic acid dehalogenase type II
MKTDSTQTSTTSRRRAPRPSAARLAVAGVEAVALDAYGTLINLTDPDFIVIMAEICDRQGLQADAADIWRRFLRAAYLMRAENHHQPVFKHYGTAWADQFRRVFRRLHLDGDPVAASLYLKGKLAAAPAFEEAYTVIDALRPHYRLAVLSNSDDDFLTACLERNGLRFEAVVTSERARALKPDPAIFLHLARQMELPPERILYAGDNPVPDVLGPRQAGMKAAWINRSGRRRPRRVPPPDLRLRSLSELLPFLERRHD